MNNITSFPLFESLDKNIPKKDLTGQQKQEFIDKISNMDNTGKELVYALIMVFYNITDKPSVNECLPYKGQSIQNQNDRKDITWIFSDFPIRLRHILYKFVILHEKKMNEDPLQINTE